MDNRIVECPFNSGHKIEESRLPTHIFNRCKTYKALIQSKSPIYKCKYNYLHMFPNTNSLEEHQNNCPDQERFKESAPIQLNEDNAWGTERRDIGNVDNRMSNNLWEETKQREGSAYGNQMDIRLNNNNMEESIGTEFSSKAETLGTNTYSMSYRSNSSGGINSESLFPMGGPQYSLDMQMKGNAKKRGRLEMENYDEDKHMGMEVKRPNMEQREIKIEDEDISLYEMMQEFNLPDNSQNASSLFPTSFDNQINFG